jgi:hypothetical protein
VSSATREAGCWLTHLQYVDQVGVGIDAVEPAGDNQALDDADLFCAKFGPAEER